MVLVMFSTLVYSFTVTTMTDGTSIENLTFTGDENISRNVTFNRFDNVTSAFINLTGYNSFTFSDITNADVESTVGSGATGYYYSNYTKLNNTVGAVWQVQHGKLSTYNITIPQDCWDYDTDLLVLKFQTFFSANTGTDVYSEPYCYNSTWKSIGTKDVRKGFSTSFAGAGSINWHDDVFDVKYTCRSGSVFYDGGAHGGVFCTMSEIRIYEEAVYWNTTIYPDNTYLEVGTPDNNYEWSLPGAEFKEDVAMLDELNNTNTSQNMTFTTNENITIGLQIPINANVISATVQLSGFNVSYKEQDNDDTWNCTGDWNNVCDGFASPFDEDCVSQASWASSGTANYYLNYTKREGALRNTTQWFTTTGNAGTRLSFKTITEACWSQVPIQLRSNSSAPDDASYFYCYNGTDWDLLQNYSSESNDRFQFCEYMLWGLENYTDNTNLEVGTPDGTHEWNYTGEFNVSNNKTDDFSSQMNTYLSICTADTSNNCQVPLQFGSNQSGILQINSININYTNITKTLDFASELNTALNSNVCDCTGCLITENNCTIPLQFHSDEIGIIQYSAIDITHEDITTPIASSTRVVPSTVTFPDAISIYLNVSDESTTIDSTEIKVQLEDPNAVITNFTMTFNSGNNSYGETSEWLKSYITSTPGSHILKFYFADSNGKSSNTSDSNLTFTVTAPGIPPGGNPGGGGGGARPRQIVIIEEANITLRVSPSQIDGFIFYTSFEGESQTKFLKTIASKTIDSCEITNPSTVENFKILCNFEQQNVNIGLNISTDEFITKEVNGIVTITSGDEIIDIPTSFTVINTAGFISLPEIDIPIDFPLFLKSKANKIVGIRLFTLAIVAVISFIFLIRRDNIQVKRLKF